MQLGEVIARHEAETAAARDHYREPAPEVVADSYAEASRGDTSCPETPQTGV